VPPTSTDSATRQATVFCAGSNSAPSVTSGFPDTTLPTTLVAGHTKYPDAMYLGGVARPLTGCVGASLVCGGRGSGTGEGSESPLPAQSRHPPLGKGALWAWRRAGEGIMDITVAIMTAKRSVRRPLEDFAGLISHFRDSRTNHALRAGHR
jgi:hypothetical protein